MKSRTRTIARAIGGLLGVILLVGLSFVARLLYRDYMIRSIRVGMTAEAVQKVLGEPKVVQKDGATHLMMMGTSCTTNECWDYDNGRTSMFRVCFDSSGRVTCTDHAHWWE